MLLVIDVGNTNTSLGVYEGERLVTHWRLTTARERTVDEYGVHARNLFALAGLDFQAITAVAIASVVPPLNFTLKRMAELYFHHTPLFIDHTTDTGMPIDYEPPSDVGADRIVDAVAAIRRYGAPCIVVDFGTATTFDAINADGHYLGGVISPGITISSDALFERAARLPRVEIKRPQTVIGASTVGSIQSGLFYGYVGLVDGILRRMREELGAQTRVVATGGLAPLIAAGSELIETVDDTLTLEGLRIIYERTEGSKLNVQSSKLE
ncbi:MAG TPA: type III pantothenate kinase [Pyrinomonadaceae bacterium]|nr:type III pantothenate kinase [Pyrinomonadaceae bacterium]